MCIFNPWYQISGRLENRFAKQAEIRFLRPTIYWQMMQKSIRRITRVLKLCVYLFWKKIFPTTLVSSLYTRNSCVMKSLYNFTAPADQVKNIILRGWFWFGGVYQCPCGGSVVKGAAFVNLKEV